ncbi:hypothetical protein BpHYR1_008342 [Brachionus plicatilis]|uniref:Uncharacterized protein n=1 Tax=Brachionus plicatilis TaxID=10195 RepID=A0A3M7SCJ9_BRAPC|nr:hypothetical protein BpHYR1_008342 [Brachionus plicatilis]
MEQITNSIWDLFLGMALTQQKELGPKSSNFYTHLSWIFLLFFKTKIFLSKQQKNVNRAFTKEIDNVQFSVVFRSFSLQQQSNEKAGSSGRTIGNQLFYKRIMLTIRWSEYKTGSDLYKSHEKKSQIQKIQVLTLTLTDLYILHHQVQLSEYISYAGYINRPHRSRMTVKNLENTTLLRYLIK